MKRLVIPTSGGIDSTVLLHYAKKEVKFDEIYCIHYRYGQRHWTAEHKTLALQLQELDIQHIELINLDFCKSLTSSSALTNENKQVDQTKTAQGVAQINTYVPFRNTMILSIACAHAENVSAETVYHGAAQVDTLAGFWDGSVSYLEAMNNITALNRKHKITIEAPLIDKSKKEIIELGLRLGVNFKNTHTCYDPKWLITMGEYLSCGTCTACGARIKGFIDAGYIDPIQYRVEIPWQKYNCKEI